MTLSILAIIIHSTFYQMQCVWGADWLEDMVSQSMIEIVGNNWQIICKAICIKIHMNNITLIVVTWHQIQEQNGKQMQRKRLGPNYCLLRSLPLFPSSRSLKQSSKREYPTVTNIRISYLGCLQWSGSSVFNIQVVCHITHLMSTELIGSFWNDDYLKKKKKKCHFLESECQFKGEPEGKLT